MLLIEMRNECLYFRLENGITVPRAEMTRSVINWLTQNSRLISCKLWLFLMFHRDSWVWFYFTLWKYCPLIVWKTFSNFKEKYREDKYWERKSSITDPLHSFNTLTSWFFAVYYWHNAWECSFQTPKNSLLFRKNQ